MGADRRRAQHVGASFGVGIGRDADRQGAMVPDVVGGSRSWVFCLVSTWSAAESNLTETRFGTPVSKIVVPSISALSL